MANLTTTTTDEVGEFLVPHNDLLVRLDACANQLAKVSTIPDVLRVVTQAEAIAVITRKVKASQEMQEAALRLLLAAEAQLGRITAQIPSGRKGHSTVADRNRPTRSKVLAEHDIGLTRANRAERLASIPPERVELAIASLTKPSMHGVFKELGLRSASPYDHAPEKLARDLAYLTDEAICLLERSIKTNTVPHVGTVSEYRRRFTTLQGNKR